MKKIIYVLCLVTAIIIGSAFLVNSTFAAGTVTPATNGDDISVDDYDEDPAAATYTTLTGPTLTCDAVGDIANNSTITITAPTGFIFNVNQLVEADPTNEIALGGEEAADPLTVTPTTKTITIPVTVGNTTTAEASIVFSDIQVTPESPVPTTGQLSVTFSAGSFGDEPNAGALESVAGNLDHWEVTTAGGGTETAGAAFTLTITAKDQHGNDTDKNASGGALGTETFTINTNATASASANDPTYDDSTFPKTDDLDITSGSVTTANVLLYNSDESDPEITVSADAGGVTTGAVTVTVNPATADSLSFTTEPDPTAIVANVAFTVQPVITILDAFGNTRTGDTDEIELSSYSNGACSTPLVGLAGTLTKEAVAGVADFSGQGVKFQNSTNTLYIGAANNGPSACFGPIEVSPAAPTISCHPAGQAGLVRLSWAIPYGVKSSGATYEGQLIAGTSVVWDAAGNTEFGTDWETGTPGTATQEFVTGLNPNTQYAFMMRALGNNDLESVNSNTVVCVAPSSATGAIDTTPPTSYITSPAMNAYVLANEPLVIKGTARDEGGSSVQKVEVSTDGGTSWSNSTVLEVTEDNFIWEFTWQSPVIGEQIIKTRAYDWVGNRETPGDGIKINVVNELPEVVDEPDPEPDPDPKPDPTDPDPKPITEMTPTEMRAEINRLLDVLEQLQQQLAVMRGEVIVPSACVGVTLTRNLAQGATGNDVKCLQALLNQDVATRVSSTGVGSPGQETTYFGALTRSAVIRFQEKYASDILTPLNLVSGTGFVGSSTRAKLNSMLGR